MTIMVTKYRRLGGGCDKAHSPIEVSNLSENQRVGLIAYLNTQGFYAQPIDDVVMIYKSNVERGGLFGLRKIEMPIPCSVEEVLPHIEANLPGEEIQIGQPQGYISDD
jgi:hypothetical protein